MGEEEEYAEQKGRRKMTRSNCPQMGKKVGTCRSVSSSPQRRQRGTISGKDLHRLYMKAHIVTSKVAAFASRPCTAAGDATDHRTEGWLRWQGSPRRQVQASWQSNGNREGCLIRYGGCCRTGFKTGNGRTWKECQRPKRMKARRERQGKDIISIVDLGSCNRQH